MTTPSFIEENRESIRASLITFLTEYQSTLKDVTTLGEEAIQTLLKFIQKGKFLRGSLVILFTKIYNGEVTKETVKTAACLELMHSAILIHDDIMDNDILRRGDTTVYKQYEEEAKNKMYLNAESYGKSLAICVGDIGFFLTFELLSSLEIDSTIKLAIITYFSRELVKVGAAQMQDLEFSSNPRIPQEDEILRMYKYKTGRYSFVLPSTMGALLAGKKLEDLNELEKLGELMGVLFQIKDDEVGLFSTESVSGKSKASDIREGKKTVLYGYLHESSSTLQKQLLKEIFGNKNVTDDQLVQLNMLIEQLHIKEKVNLVINNLAVQIKDCIKNLGISDTYKDVLYSLLEFNLRRSS